VAMVLNDDVYGRIALSNDLLEDLISSAAIQRLKKVSQAGAASLVRPGRTVTRYEHSVGVMVLTGQLGGKEIEQAAGLLQDVSHTAFSHTIDYVFGDRSERFHERIFAGVVENSDLPRILQRHGLTWQDIYQVENLVRVDVSAPLLCADRIDYTLRDLLRLNFLTHEDIRKFLSAIDFIENKVVLTDIDQADAFVRWYRYLVGDVFMNPLDLFINDEFVRILKVAMGDGFLREEDLLGTDDLVLTKIRGSEKISAELRSLEQIESVRLGPGPGARKVYSKGRVIDPPVLTNGDVKPLSTLRPETAKIWDAVLSCANEGILVNRV
jgi:HD superfamily phosphohydrolase